jgi:hypothetical protein
MDIAMDGGQPRRIGTQNKPRSMRRRGAGLMNIPYPPEHYYQNQGMVPKTGPVECVTTSVVIVINMIKDRLAHDLKEAPIADISVKEYAAKLDGMGLSALRYRLPSDFFLAIGRGWMHPVLQVPSALKQFAKELRKRQGCTFKVEQTSWNTLDDITRNIQGGNYVIVHGLWQVTNRKEVQYKFGGWPHSMVPVEIDSQADKVFLLNPAYPDPRTIDPDNPATYPVAVLDAMPTQEFMAFWGRRSILNLYTRPFTMTVVIPDTNKESPP